MHEINNTQVNDAHDVDVVMLMNNLIEQSHIYSKTSGSLRQYYRDKQALDNNNNIADFLANNNNDNNNEMLLVNCEISLMLNSSKSIFSRWYSSKSRAKIYND